MTLGLLTPFLPLKQFLIFTVLEHHAVSAPSEESCHVGALSRNAEYMGQ